MKPLYRLALRLCAPDIVSDLYRAILGRDPDREGSAAYAEQLGPRGSLTGVVADICRSREAWERNLYARPDELLRLIFRGLCGTGPGAAAHGRYTAQLTSSRDLPETLATALESQELWEAIVRCQAGQIVASACRSLLRAEPDEPLRHAYCNQLTESKDLQQLLSSIAGSREHWAMSVSTRAEELVHGAYESLLKRKPDQQALRDYAGQLRESADLSRIYTSIAQSQEHWERLLALRTEDLVRSVYDGLLDREPDDHALRVYSAQLRENKSIAKLLAAIARSQEHRNRLFAGRAEEMIQAAYTGLLNREPDEEALRTYSKQLRESESLAVVLANIAHSREHWHNMLGQRADELVRGACEALLERLPDEQAMRGYAVHLRDTRDLPRFLSTIAQSQEHWTMLLDLRAEELVRSAYHALLKTEPDAQALQLYCAQLRNSRSVPQLLATLADSPEHWRATLASRAAELVDAAYQGLLARAPDEQALGHYSAQLAEHKDLAGLLANLSESQEHWAQLLALRSEDLVRCVYRALLNREPDEEALRSYAEHVRQDRSLTRLLSAVADSDEHWRILMAARAEELVRTAHQELSGTEPEENMVRSCAAQLRETRDLRPLLSSVARSPEHRDAILAINAESVVRAVHRGTHNREPDDQTLARHLTKFTASRDLSALVADIASSPEQRAPNSKGHAWPHPSASYEKPTLVFLHIQKTAGTSVQNMLREAFAPEKIYREYVDTLHLHSPAELSAYSVFAGHFNYDSLAFIPRRKISAITFVREPRKRLTSLYNFWRAHEPTHRSYSGGVVLANQLSMREFFLTPEIEDRGVWNHMTWAIMGERCWRHWRNTLRSAAEDAQPEAEFLARTVRPAIRQRLREFLFVGIQEDFARSAQLLFKAINRRPPTVRADHSLRNLMTGDPHFKKNLRRQSVTAEVEAAVSRLVVLDDIVYGEAKALYAERLSGAREQVEQPRGRDRARNPAAGRHSLKRRSQR